jgi:hypothetical protein
MRPPRPFGGRPICHRPPPSSLSLSRPPTQDPGHPSPSPADPLTGLPWHPATRHPPFSLPARPWPAPAPGPGRAVDPGREPARAALPVYGPAAAGVGGGGAGAGWEEGGEGGAWGEGGARGEPEADWVAAMWRGGGEDDDGAAAGAAAAAAGGGGGGGGAGAAGGREDTSSLAVLVSRGREEGWERRDGL